MRHGYYLQGTWVGSFGKGLDDTEEKGGPKLFDTNIIRNADKRVIAFAKQIGTKKL